MVESETALARVRLPLQVGTSALLGVCRAGASLVPAYLLGIYAGWLGFAMADNGNVDGYSIALVLVPVVACFLFLRFGWLHLRLAFRARPSDLVFEADGFRIEGGTLHGFRAPWASEHVRNLSVDAGYRAELDLSGMLEWLRRYFEPPGVVLDEKPPNYWRLLLPRGGAEPALVLAVADDEAEAASLEALRDALIAASTPAGERTAADQRPRDLLVCAQCGAPATPADLAAVACLFCGSAVSVPEPLRLRVRALIETAEARARSSDLAAKLLRQPGARQASFTVALAAIPSVLAWPAATVGEALLYINCLTGVGGGLLLLLTPIPIALGSFFLVRGRFSDRAALRLLTLGFAARPHAGEAGTTYDCRRCGGPLPGGSVLVGCAYCGADNVIGVDVPRLTRPEENELGALEDALVARSRERRRWALGWVLSLAAFLVSGLVAFAAISPPNEVVPIAPARALTRITYGTDDDYLPRLSPDGQSLVYYEYWGRRSGEFRRIAPDGGFLSDSVARRELDGRDVRWLPHPRYQHTTSPDGSHVAYANRVNGILQILTKDANGKNLRTLTQDACDHDDPVWSPDGKFIAYVDQCPKLPKDTWRLCVMAADGSGQRPLTRSAADIAHLAWTRIGLYFSSNVAGNYDIWRIELPGFAQ